VAVDLLKEMEALAQQVEAVCGRRRRVTPTTLRIYPYFPGASAALSGSVINFDGGVFYDEIPGFSHGCAHELTHNFAFTHGGLQELVVEVVRSGGEQVSGQEQKWLFLDRMNGLKRTDTWYPNTGLYLYCYSQGGKRFLGFVLTWEDKVRKALSAQRFSDDEVTAALCSLGVGRDLLVVCQRWGLNVSGQRLRLATRAAQQVVDTNR
jgi:hypothetical protein